MPNTIVAIKSENSGKAGSRLEAPNRREKNLFSESKITRQ